MVNEPLEIVNQILATFYGNISANQTIVNTLFQRGFLTFTSHSQDEIVIDSEPTEPREYKSIEKWQNLNCFRCDVALEDAIPGTEEHPVENQPYKGTVFVATGQYGSTAWDPFNGDWLELNICDDCLTSLPSRVLHGRSIQTSETTYSKWDPEWRP